MSEKYIRSHFDDIKKYASVIENRPDDSFCTMESVLEDNKNELAMCRRYGADFVFIDSDYNLDSVL